MQTEQPPRGGPDNRDIAVASASDSCFDQDPPVHDVAKGLKTNARRHIFEARHFSGTPKASPVPLSWERFPRHYRTCAHSYCAELMLLMQNLQDVLAKATNDGRTSLLLTSTKMKEMQAQEMWMEK